MRTRFSMARWAHRRLLGGLGALAALVGAGAAAAGSLAVGPIEGQAACQRFCDEMVHECRLAIYSAASSICLVWDERGWYGPEGLTIATPTEADCAAVSDALGWAFWWDGVTGWCRQGVRDLACAPGDWEGLWDTTYEDMRLSVADGEVVGTYRLQSGRDYAIRGQFLAGDGCVLVGEWDHNDGDSGPLRFEMTGPGEFHGTWSSGLPPTARSPANWTGTRYPSE